MRSSACGAQSPFPVKPATREATRDATSRVRSPGVLSSFVANGHRAGHTVRIRQVRHDQVRQDTRPGFVRVSTHGLIRSHHKSSGVIRGHHPFAHSEAKKVASHLAAKVCDSPLDPRVEYGAQVTELVLLLSRHLPHLMRGAIREAIRGHHGGNPGGHQSSCGPPPLQACPARSRDIRARTRPRRASRRPCP